MLTGAGFGDDALLAHPPGENGLPDGIVDLVRSGVQEVLPLEVNLGSAEVLGQALGIVKRRLAAAVVGQQVHVFLLKGRVVLRLQVFLFELLQGAIKRLGNELAPVLAKVTGGVGRVDR